MLAVASSALKPLSTLSLSLSLSLSLTHKYFLSTLSITNNVSLSLSQRSIVTFFLSLAFFLLSLLTLEIPITLSLPISLSITSDSLSLSFVNIHYIFVLDFLSHSSDLPFSHYLSLSLYPCPSLLLIFFIPYHRSLSPTLSFEINSVLSVHLL